MQKQKGKLVFSKSGVFHICHIVSSVAQGQDVVKISINWSEPRPRYEIYVIKISLSPENKKMDFSNFPQGLKVFPCVYIMM